MNFIGPWGFRRKGQQPKGKPGGKGCKHDVWLEPSKSRTFWDVVRASFAFCFIVF